MVNYICGEQYYFDLELPVQQRYAHMIKKYIPLIKQYLNIWINDAGVTEEDLLKFDKLAEFHPDRELIEDCKYFADICEVSLRNMLYLQYMYDFGFSETVNMGCTSILVSPKLRYPYIVRNLDWDYNDLIRSLTINAHYTRGGQVVFTQLAIVGQLSVGHTIKSDKVCISLHFLQPEYTKKQLLNMILENPQYPSIIRLLRKLLEDGCDFNRVSEKIGNTVVQHHGLLNVIGTNKDEVRIFYVQDWSGCDKFSKQVYLTDKSYLISTNGTYFQFSVARLTACEQNMAQLDEKQLEDPSQVMKVIRKYPNTNDATILSTIMECNNSQYQIVI